MPRGIPALRGRRDKMEAAKMRTEEIKVTDRMPRTECSREEVLDIVKDFLTEKILRDQSPVTSPQRLSLE